MNTQPATPARRVPVIVPAWMWGPGDAAPTASGRTSAGEVTTDLQIAGRTKGYRHPLLTLELGIACHQAMIDVCADFERRSQTRSAGAR